MPNLRRYLAILCRCCGCHLEQYQRGKWIYIRITPAQNRSLNTSASSFTALIQTWRPHARLVRGNEKELVFNIGTVFNTILECAEKPCDLP